MTSNIHRFLSRRDRRPKVILSPSPSTASATSSATSALSTLTASVYSSLLFWRHRGPRSSKPNHPRDDNEPGHRKRRSSSSSAWTAALDLPFSLDGAGSIRRPRKRPASAHLSRRSAIASTANCDTVLTLQATLEDVAPDEGTFAGFFVPDEESRKKKVDKDEEKAVCGIEHLFPL